MAPALLLAAFVAACGNSEPAASNPAVETSPEAPAEAPPTEPTEQAPSPATVPDCDELRRQGQATLHAALVADDACTFDHECVEVSVATRCASNCATAVPAGRLEAVRAAVTELDEGLCATFAEHDCTMPREECARSTPRCSDGRCLMDEGDAPLRDVPIPEANRAGQNPPPPRPAPGDPEQERGRRLFAAIAAGDPALAQDFFFPREAFAKVKAIADPDGYWQRLFARYAQDIRALHEELGDLSGAEFDRLDIIRRGGWVPRGDEGNALPYWVSRHSQLYYRVGEAERSLEVRVLITWGDRWYVTHLNEFH